jgi:hypothetical protein
MADAYQFQYTAPFTFNRVRTDPQRERPWTKNLTQFNSTLQIIGLHCRTI